MSKNIKLSSTRINSFLSCKQKYWFSYHSKIPKLSNPSFKLGIAVHESLELAGKIWKEKEKFTKKDKEAILAKYDEVSIREGVESYDTHTEGKELVERRINNFMTGRKILGLEYRFGFRDDDTSDIITDLGVPIMGAIDKVEEYDDDTIVIIDYKTSKTAPTPYQLKGDIQLSLYDIVARKLFPGYKRVILALDMLKSEVLFTYRTDEQRANFERYLKEIYNQMLSLKEEEVRASLNMFCPWCDYKDYCSTYQRAYKKSDYTFLPTMSYSNEELISEWEMVKSVKKILESREKELSMVMMEKIVATSSNVVGDTSEVYVRQSSRTNYDIDVVKKHVPIEDFVNLVTLNKKAVETYMDTNPAMKTVIEESSTTNFTTPFLASRKIKK